MSARFKILYSSQSSLRSRNEEWPAVVFKWAYGKNKLGQIAKTMSEQAGFKRRHVNHSGRKTCITKLLDTKTPPTEVAQLSGHKNLMSLNHYNTVSLQKQIDYIFYRHIGHLSYFCLRY